MAFEEDPVMRRLAIESAAARMPEELPAPAPSRSEPGVPEPVKRVLKIGVALGLIHELTGWSPPGPFGR
ncbi:MAG TPA: hypothetical protein VGJ32_05975 [Solirubrobacteraceae bacterium]|jgi:hypothetical protein